MSAQSIQPAFTTFQDIDGQPLEGGMIYIGTAGLAAATNQITVYWDAALTQAATQPIRTTGGFPVNNGAPAMIYTGAEDFSIAINDKNNSSVISALNKTGYYATYYTANLTGGVSRSLESKLLDVVSVKDFGAVGDGVTDDTSSIQAAIDSGSNSIVFPSGTYKVSSLTISGSNYELVTCSSVTLSQINVASRQNTPILAITGDNIKIGDLKFSGNIATDAGEWNHCISIGSGCENITLGNLHGENIRGDVLYVGGLAASPVTGVSFGTITGTNIYRCLFSLIGGDVTGQAIVSAGTIGYRDICIEPNAGGTGQPGNLILDYYKGGLCQFVSADNTLANENVDITKVDLDQARVSNSTPTYASGHGTSPIAMSLSYCKQVHIGSLKFRDYNFVPLWCATAVIKSNISIDHLDIANCDITDATYNTMVYDGLGVNLLRIGKADIDLFSNSKFCFRGDTSSSAMLVQVQRGTITGGLVALNCNGLQLNASDVDVGGSSGAIIQSCPRASITDTSFTDAASASLLYDTDDAILQNVTGTFSAVTTSNSDRIHAISSTLNSVLYQNDVIGSNVQTKAGSIAFATSGTAAVTLAVAEGNANYRVLVTGDIGETFWVTGISTSGFTVNSSNASSTATVTWFILRYTT